jgi:HSP20 family protein
MSLFARGLDPFNELFDLQRNLDSTFRAPGQRWEGPARSRAFPPVNVFRNKDGYLIRMEVPGVTDEDLSIEAAGRTLTIGARRAAREGEGVSTHRLERRSGEFSRAIRLPEDADCENIEATLKNGILSVQIDQHAAAKPRQISVSVQ